MTNPDITVYIPSYNKGEFLAEAIESVLRQTVDNWELLIINDNSSDCTESIMSRYEGDERIRTYTLEGVGLPAVCNFAVTKGRGRYVVRLDGDDIFDENILLILFNTLERSSQMAYVFPDYYLVDRMNEIIGIEYRQQLYSDNHMVDLPPNGACTMMRKDVLLEVGGYREDLGVQDGFDIWSKIRQAGYIGTNVNLPLFRYRRYDGNITNNNKRIEFARRAIKRESCLAKLEQLRPIFMVIPCRQNYDYSPDLWSLPLRGKSLLERKIETCIGSDLFDKIIVACDNDAVHSVVEQYDDPRLAFQLRETRSTLLSVPVGMAMREIMLEYDPHFSGISVLSYLQTPFVTLGTIEEAVYTLALNGADSSVCVDEIDATVFKRTPYGLLPVNSVRELRSDFDKVYCETRTSLATKNENLRNGSLIGSKAVYFPVAQEETFYIDSQQKMEIATVIAQAGHR